MKVRLCVIPSLFEINHDRSDDINHAKTSSGERRLSAFLFRDIHAVVCTTNIIIKSQNHKAEQDTSKCD